MNVIILAAGIGSRLYPLTKNTPKCLLKINTETILHRAIRVIDSVKPELKKNIAIGFAAEKIIKEIKKFNSDVNIVINPFFRITNSIASLWFLRSSLKDDVIIINADICFSKEVFKTILEYGEDNFMVIDSSREYSDAGYKVTIENNLIVDMGKIISPDSYSGEYAGITKLNKNGATSLASKIEDMLFEEEYKTWYETALLKLIKENKLNLHYLDIKGLNWVEIDSAEDLQYAQKISDSL